MAVSSRGPIREHLAEHRQTRCRTAYPPPARALLVGGHIADTRLISGLSRPVPLFWSSQPVSSYAPVHCVAVSAKALPSGGTGLRTVRRQAGSPLLAVMTGHPDARITIWECATGRPISTCGLQPASIGRKLLFNPNDVTQLAALIVKPPPPAEHEPSSSQPAAATAAASARPRLQRQASFGATARITSPPRRAAQTQGANADDDSPAELRQSLREEVPLGSVRLFRLQKPLPGSATAARRTVQAAFDAAEAVGETAGLPDLETKAPTLSESAAAAGLPAAEASKAALERYPALQGMPPALPLTDFCWDGEGSRLVLLSAFARVLVVADGALAQEVCPLGPAAAAAVEDSVLGPVGHPLACDVAHGYRLPHWSTLPGAPDGAGDRPAVPPPRLLCVGSWPRGFAVGGEDGILCVYVADDVAEREGRGHGATAQRRRTGGTVEAPGANAAALADSEAEAAMEAMRRPGKAGALAGRGALAAVGVRFAPSRRMRLTAPLSRTPATVTCVSAAPAGADAAVALGPGLWSSFDGGAATRDRRRLARLVAAAAVAMRQQGPSRRSLLGLGPSQGGRTGAAGPGSRDPLAIARGLVLGGGGGASRSQPGKQVTAADALEAAGTSGSAAAAVLPFGPAADAIGGCGSRRAMIVDWWSGREGGGAGGLRASGAAVGAEGGGEDRGVERRPRGRQGGRRMSVVAGDFASEAGRAEADLVAAVTKGRRAGAEPAASSSGDAAQSTSKWRRGAEHILREAAAGRRSRGPASLGAIGLLSTSSSAMAASSAAATEGADGAIGMAGAPVGGAGGGRGGDVRREIAARAEEAEHRERKASGRPLAGATVAEAAAAALRWGRLGPPTPVTPEIQVAGCHARGVAAVDVASAGSTVVTAGRRDGAVVVWELALRRPLALRCYGPGSDPVAVACHQTGGRIIVVVAGAAAGAEELVVAAGASLVPHGPLINGAPAYCAKYGSGAAAGMSVVGSTRAAVVYSVGGARGGASAALAILVGHTGPVVGAEFVRGGGGIATAGDDGSVFLFSAADFGEPATSAGPITRRQLEAAASSTTPGAKGSGGFLVTRPLAVVRTGEAPLLRGASHVVQMTWVSSEETAAQRRERAAQRHTQLGTARARGRRGSIVGGMPGEKEPATRDASREQGWWDIGGFLFAMRALDAVQARRQARGRRDSMTSPPPLPWEAGAARGASSLPEDGASAGGRTPFQSNEARSRPAQRRRTEAAVPPPRHAPRELVLWQSADVEASGLDPGLKSVVLATPLTATHVCRLPPIRRPDLAIEALDRAAGASPAESEHLLRGGVVVWGATEDGAVGPLGVSRAVHAAVDDSSAEDLAMHTPGAQGKAVDKVEAPTHSRVLPPDRTLVAGARWARPHAGPVRAIRAAADACCIVSAGAVDGVVAVLLVEGATLAATGSSLQLPLLPDTAVRAGAAVALGMDAPPRRGAGARVALAAAGSRTDTRHRDSDNDSDDDAEVAVDEPMWPAPALTLWEARQSGLAALLAGGVASLGSGGAVSIIASAMGEGGGGNGDDDDDGAVGAGEGGGGEADDGTGGGGDGLRGLGTSGGLAGAAAEAAVHFGTPGSAVVAVAAARWERERSRRQQLEGEIQDQLRAHHYELQDAVAAERARLQAEAHGLKSALELETRGRAADREDFESRDGRLRAEAKAAEMRRLRSLMDLERRRAEAEEQARSAVSEAQFEAEEERLRSLREVSAQMAARQASETHIASRFEDAVVAARKEREEALGRVDDVRELLEQELSQQADAADQAVTQSREEAKRAQAEARKAAVEGRVALKAKDAALAAMEAALARAEEAVEAQRRRADAAELKASEHATNMATSKEAERRAKASASDLMQMLADSRERTQAVDATRKMALGELEAQKGSVQPRETLIVRLRREADGMAEEVTKAQAAAKRTRTALSQASAAYKAQLAEAKRARRDAATAESTLRRAAALVEGLAKEALGASGADDGSKAWRSLGTRLYRMLVLGDDSGTKEQNPEDVDSDEDEASRAMATLASASLLADPSKARRTGRQGQRRASRPPVALPAVGRGSALSDRGSTPAEGTSRTRPPSGSERRGPALRAAVATMAASMHGSTSLAAPHAQRRAVGDGRKGATATLSAATPITGSAPSLRTQDFERQRRALVGHSESMRRGRERAEAELKRVERRLREENTTVIEALNHERRQADAARRAAERATAKLPAAEPSDAGSSAPRPPSSSTRRPSSAASSASLPMGRQRARRGSGGEGNAMRELRRLASGDLGFRTMDSTVQAATPRSRSRSPSPSHGARRGSPSGRSRSPSPSGGGGGTAAAGSLQLVPAREGDASSRAVQRLAAMAQSSPLRARTLGRRG